MPGCLPEKLPRPRRRGHSTLTPISQPQQISPRTGSAPGFLYAQILEAAVMDAAERRMIASIAAHDSWANTRDRTARTAAGRLALEEKFLQDAGGDPVRARAPSQSTLPAARTEVRTVTSSRSGSNRCGRGRRGRAHRVWACRMNAESRPEAAPEVIAATGFSVNAAGVTAAPLERMSAPARIRAECGWLPKPPDVPCPWCSAEPGQHCLAAGRRQPARRRRLYLAPDGCHPSRRGAA